MSEKKYQKNMKHNILKFLRPDVKPFNPSKPDAVTKINIPASSFVEIEKPDRN